MNRQNVFLQWNLRGFAQRRDEVRYLLNTYNPTVFAVQETKFKPGKPSLVNGYSCLHKEPQVEANGRSHGGVALYVRRNVGLEQITLNTDLQAVAAKIKMPVNLTVCSLYLPYETYTINDVKDLMDQMPRPLLLLGDFNTHHRTWGSGKGRELLQLLEDQDLVLLNDGRPTHFTSHSGNFS